MCRLIEHAENRDEFLAMISHELRTPIAAILSWIELLNRKPADYNLTNRALEVIKLSAQIQARLIEDLVDYSRITNNKLLLTTQVVSLDAVLKAAVDGMMPIACNKLVALKSEVVSIETLVEGDSIRLQQVFSNLLANAVKFTPNGGEVRVKLEISKHHYIVTVSDNGEGISAELLPLIFDPYWQASRRASRLGGLGLGLTIARHIIELHGGTINAESFGKGQGAVFTVRLPNKQPGYEDRTPFA